MAIPNTGEHFNQLPKVIQKAIQEGIERAMIEEFEFAKKRLEARKTEIVAGVILNVQRMMRVETHGVEMIIRIELEK